MDDLYDIVDEVLVSHTIQLSYSRIHGTKKFQKVFHSSDVEKSLYHFLFDYLIDGDIELIDQCNSKMEAESSITVKLFSFKHLNMKLDENCTDNDDVEPICDKVQKDTTTSFVYTTDVNGKDTVLETLVNIIRKSANKLSTSNIKISNITRKKSGALELTLSDATGDDYMDE